MNLGWGSFEGLSSAIIGAVCCEGCTLGYRGCTLFFLFDQVYDYCYGSCFVTCLLFYHPSHSDCMCFINPFFSTNISPVPACQRPSIWTLRLPSSEVAMCVEGYRIADMCERRAWRIALYTMHTAFVFLCILYCCTWCRVFHIKQLPKQLEHTTRLQMTTPLSKEHEVKKRQIGHKSTLTWPWMG